MSRKRSSGIAVALAVAGVYAYFLLFAQFAFLELLQAKVSGQGLKVVLSMMAIGGVVSGFAVSSKGKAGRGLFIAAMITCAVVARCSTLTGSVQVFALLSLVMGASLGTATVCLASLIGRNLEPKRGCVWVGLGTGMAYACCNIPVVFMAAPTAQASISAALATLAALGGAKLQESPQEIPGARAIPWRAILIFGALVWMDSAAFYVIQHAPELKDGTWGEGRLWRNAGVHFTAALLAGFWLSKDGWKSLCVTAWALLALAGWWVNQAATRDWAGWIYPAGVSLYSTALVAWPGLLAERSGTSGRSTASRAAWLFGIAGWIGSANGIGMVESLQRVPGVFLIAAGVVVLVGTVLGKPNWRSVMVVGGIGLAAFAGVPTRATQSDPVARGREVYVSEGCIHCHSQYVRPDTVDEELWGPVRPADEILKGQPVLIGNRRQGPDLTHVGARRSAAWLKLHFIDPRAFSRDSVMPSYAHLFQSGKGDDLVQYLRESGMARIPDILAKAAEWQPNGTSSGKDGSVLFSTHCAMCHGEGGQGNGPLAGSFQRPPANLVEGPFAWTPPGEGLELRLAQVIKFGLPGTDMPGHEVLEDAEVLALRDHLLRLRR